MVLPRHDLRKSRARCVVNSIRWWWRRRSLLSMVMARFNEHCFSRMHSMHSAGPWPISIQLVYCHLMLIRYQSPMRGNCLFIRLIAKLKLILLNYVCVCLFKLQFTIICNLVYRISYRIYRILSIPYIFIAQFLSIVFQ